MVSDFAAWNSQRGVADEPCGLAPGRSSGNLTRVRNGTNSIGGRSERFASCE
jgi:hypothetical protein